MAHKKNSKKQPELPKRRSWVPEMMRKRYSPGRGSGSHGDARKEQSRRFCRGKVRR